MDLEAVVRGVVCKRPLSHLKQIQMPVGASIDCANFKNNVFNRHDLRPKIDFKKFNSKIFDHFKEVDSGSKSDRVKNANVQNESEKNCIF